MMDPVRSTSGTGEDNIGIPDDLRCKRSDGKQWRCTAMSMPDKTVCEKHYIQAKKRAANSAMRANIKRVKTNPLDENDICLESKSDDMDSPLVDCPLSVTGTNQKVNYSPETISVKSPSVHNSLIPNDDSHGDFAHYEENLRSYSTPPFAMDSSMDRSDKESSDGTSASSDDAGGQTCHQCRRNGRVVWCLRCDKRGYCDECISNRYPDISLEDVQRICPACRGNCSCKICLRGDNLIKLKLRDIPVREKLEHLYCLLSSVLPVVKQIHSEQCSELELERKHSGNRIDLVRTKLNADEQMCCDFCRMPIIDYHRHCVKCNYDMCLSCCQDLRESSTLDQDAAAKRSKFILNLAVKCSVWNANADGIVPCPPKEYGGCGHSPLILKRIFKMNWIAKLVKNVEEMVRGCKVYDAEIGEEYISESVLFSISVQEIKEQGGIRDFKKHWMKGEPVIVKEVCDASSMLDWEPMVLLTGIQETAPEKLKCDNKTVKAIDCLDWSEIDISLDDFIRGYSEGRIRENGQPEMLVLKNWPSPGASEEFLMYQRPEFIGKLPLIEYIHTKWGLLNVAAKLPHYSLQNDVGPKIIISYGMHDELGRGDSVNNIHVNMRDVVYVLVHKCEAKLKGLQKTKDEEIQISFDESESKQLPTDTEIHSREAGSSKLSIAENDELNDKKIITDSNDSDRVDNQELRTLNCKNFQGTNEISLKKCSPGAVWDVFRKQDVPKLIEYIEAHWNEFGTHSNIRNDDVTHPLYDGAIFLDSNHKRKLKEEFRVEPWSFQQHLGEAIFIPAGCPFQLKNLQSTVQLCLDFLSPESLGEAVRISEEIRELPNNHDAKVQMLEVGKISLYAASSAIKQVHKLVLDPKLGEELGFEYPNLTSLVSTNLEQMVKQRQIRCA